MGDLAQRPLVSTSHEIPFSLRGSWFDLSPVVGLHRAAPSDLHLVSHQTGMHPVLAAAAAERRRRVPSTRDRMPPQRVLEWQRGRRA